MIIDNALKEMIFFNLLAGFSFLHLVEYTGVTVTE